MKISNYIIIFLLFAWMSINFGTEPTLPPYHKYIVSGSIICDSISDKANYTVQLFGWSYNFGKEYTLISNSARDKEYVHPIALTDSMGHYNLIVSSDIFFDSIKIGLALPQRSIIFSESYFVDKNNRHEVTEIYNVDKSSGCNCSKQVEAEETRIVRYEYYLSNTVLKLCSQTVQKD